jgi:hypothetical protein
MGSQFCFTCGTLRLSLGAPGCISRLHVTNNGAHTWYTQIEGRRLFFLFAPQQTGNLNEDGELLWAEKKSVPGYGGRHNSARAEGYVTLYSNSFIMRISGWKQRLQI